MAELATQEKHIIPRYCRNQYVLSSFHDVGTEFHITELGSPFVPRVVVGSHLSSFSSSKAVLKLVGDTNESTSSSFLWFKRSLTPDTSMASTKERKQERSPCSSRLGTFSFAVIKEHSKVGLRRRSLILAILPSK
jgi:hypothetical protein